MSTRPLIAAVLVTASDDKPGKDIPGEAHVVTASVEYRERRRAHRAVRCPKF